MHQVTKHLFGNCVVVAFTMPLGDDLSGGRIAGTWIATAEVNTKGHPVKPGDEGVVGGDRTRQIGLGVFAA